MTETELMRAHAVDAARRWIGTPYHHRASVAGAGADCLGLVRVVWRALYGAEPENVPAYSPLWAEESGGEALMGALGRHMDAVAPDAAVAGDVMVFRFAAGLPAKHAAVLSGGGRMVHAYAGRCVSETTMGPWWVRRRAGAFRWRVGTTAPETTPTAFGP